MHEKRVKSIRTKLIQAGLDGLVLFPGSTFAYFGGYTPLSLERFVALILPAYGSPVLAAPLVEADYVAERIAVKQVLTFPDHAPPAGPLGEQLAGFERSDGKKLRLGVEHARTRLFERDVLSGSMPSGLELVNADALVDTLRMSKDEEELEILREAAAIAEKAILVGCERLGPGATETDTSGVMREYIQEQGAVPFQASAISGPESAYPHASQSGRRFKRGEVVLVAAVLSWRGYYADLTLTAGIGPLSAGTGELIEGARRMQAAAAAALRSGCTADELDRAARMAGKDLAREFLHRSGHGVGLDVHEPPYLNLGDNRTIPFGAVLSIEPGLYIPGVGGARFEDEYVLTRDGTVEKLSNLPKDLIAG